MAHRKEFYTGGTILTGKLATGEFSGIDTYTDLSTREIKQDGSLSSNFGAGLGEGITVTAITSQNNITLSKILTLADNTSLRFVEPAGILRLETGNDTATDMGHNIISELGQTPVADTYTTGADQMQLEEATIPASETSGIKILTSEALYRIEFFFETILISFIL